MSRCLLKQMTIDDKESGKPQNIPLLRYYSVFNAAQCDGLPDDLVAVPPPVPVGFWPSPVLPKCGSTADPCNRERVVLPIL